MIITAHAACRGHAPENTLAGVRAALDLGADAIEVDVRCTRDGVPVLLHDATVDRTTDGEGEIASLTLRQTRRLDAGAGERIPTLRDVLAEVSGRALLVLEVKPAGIDAAVLAVVRTATAVDSCAVHSFLPPVIERFRRLEPRMPASLLTSGRDVVDWGQLFGFALSLGAQGVAVHHGAVTPELVRAAHLRELRWSTWTVNARTDVRRVAAAGVDAITTDY
ncbi:MAG: glycerophosphodiester phosphodiesterase, partial [Dehalococcoidia bacterium]|nr:glycerophosphodiester phosphodiesterase [Dehalococcoidia bacterium]